MRSSTEAAKLEINGMFWAHLFVTSLAWVGPFLFSWYVMIVAYICVQMQYQLFNQNNRQVRVSSIRKVRRRNQAARRRNQAVHH